MKYSEKFVHRFRIPCTWPKQIYSSSVIDFEPIRVKKCGVLWQWVDELLSPRTFWSEEVLGVPSILLLPFPSLMISLVQFAIRRRDFFKAVSTTRWRGVRYSVTSIPISGTQYYSSWYASDSQSLDFVQLDYVYTRHNSIRDDRSHYNGVHPL